MKLEEQVINKKIAQRLEELGVKQESLWFYDRDGIIRRTLTDFDFKSYGSAFTVAELGKSLPEGLLSYRHGKDWISCDYPNDKIPEIKADTEANARGKMKIWLIENKHIEICTDQILDSICKDTNIDKDFRKVLNGR